MAVLAYCIAESAQGGSVPAAGVLGASIHLLRQSGLACLYSEWEEAPALSGAAVRASALAFHRVLQGAFAHGAIIPFRFPTILGTRGDLEAFVREHAAEYSGALARLKDKAQMDVRISFQRRAGATGTGAAYLRARQAERAKLAAAAREFRDAGSEQIEAWRERELADGLRCFLLANRAAVPELRAGFERVRIAPELTARVTGPWPAAEFVSEGPVEERA
ncbi:MAG TPA: GvpL/GvpF family gas vesicle protein [Candidatus Acidoferrales bacterium]|nr:GvpL/GvpF family gas vesicle protein [Candidatus Acidoferrales bacterium]